MDKPRQRLIRVAPIVARQLWSRRSTSFAAALWLNKHGIMHLTSFGNSLLKEVTLPLKNLFQWWTSQQITENLSVFGSSWGLVSHGLFGVNIMIWFVNALQWLVERTHKVLWVSLLQYGKLEWQQTLTNLEIHTEHCLWECSWRIWQYIQCAKGLIITCSNLMLTWKVRPQMGSIS